MADDASFLHRWSRRKHEAARSPQASPPPAEVVPPAPLPAASLPTMAPVDAPAAPMPAPVEEPPLPPVESLTIDSDFRPFLSAKVDQAVKRAAMRKLFSDPHFNVMDGLDIYIDDYSKPDPMPEGLLDKLKGVYETIEDKVAATPEEPSAQAAAPVAAQSQAPSQAAEPAQEPPEESDERQG